VRAHQPARRAQRARAQAHCVDLLWPDISGLPLRDLRLGNFTFVPGLSGACEVPLQAARVLHARVPAAYAACARRARLGRAACAPALAAEPMHSSVRSTYRTRSPHARVVTAAGAARRA